MFQCQAQSGARLRDQIYFYSSHLHMLFQPLTISRVKHCFDILFSLLLDLHIPPQITLEDHQRLFSLEMAYLGMRLR